MSNKKRVFSEHNADIAAALNKAIEILMTHTDESLNDLMSRGLHPIATAAGLDRIAIYLRLNDQGQLGQTYVWYHGRTGNLDEELINLPDDLPFSQRMKSFFIKGECINENVQKMPKADADYLGQFGVKAIFLVPIFTRGKFWGIVTMEDHTRYRYIDEDCLDMLRAAAHLCANSFIRTEMERRVTEANEYTHTLLAAAPLGFTIFDENLCMIECNNAIASVLKTTKQHYMTHFENYSPEFQPGGKNSREQTNNLMTRALNGETFTFEWNHRTRDGEVLPFEITLTRMKYNNRYSVLAYQYDLSNIRKLEMAASEAEELTRSAINASPFPCILFDEDLQIVNCNSQAIRMLKCPDKQYLFDHYWDRLTPEYQPDGRTSQEHAKAVLQETPIGERRVYEWLNLTPDGEQIPMECTLTPVIYKDTKIAISFKYDLRNMKSLMNNLNEALERMTLASEAKGIFLSNMSHEMRTPLNTISGMASIGKNSPDLERKDYALGKIEEASTHLVGVINDVLDMSKIEANKLELVSVDFSFEKTLKKAVNTVYFRIEQKEQRFAITVDGRIPHMLTGDDLRLTQVILNLLNNAVKFTPEGGSIHLDARLVEQTDTINTIAIAVTDTGIGVTPEQQSRLFRAFEQADNGISRKFGGTGLGLAISQRIIEMMGGQFTVTSEPGKGSTFAFTFRAAAGKDNIDSLLDPSVNWKNVRIMVIDDDTGVLTYFQEMFKLRGITCDIAVTGEEALKRTEANGIYDIYFVDWGMPGMNGIEFTRKVKAFREEHRRKSVVIMISASDWGLICDDAKEAGVDKYLMKPFFASDIIDCMNACMGIPENAAAIPNQPASASANAGEFKGCRILLAEDVEINREILIALMEDTGVTIDCAENGREALQMVQTAAHKYDLVFMDMQMPEMDGLEATRCIRRFNSKIPIIAMTANVFREDIEKCREAGMNDHLGKPFDMEDIMKKVRKYRKKPRVL